VVPSQHEPRPNGKSGYTFSKLVSLWGNMIVAFSLYPVRLLGLGGLIAMLAGIGYGIYTFIAYFTPLIKDPEPLERLNATLWFFRGVQLLFIAIVAEYVGRIYMQINRDPQFIVRSIQRHRPRT
jgi:undecaprenyl-phosphate 4-deoxy-4-formamido-L-arabinose transferase